MVGKTDLKKQILLEEIPDNRLEALLPYVSSISLKSGEVLFSEGQETKGIYMVRSGRIDVSKTTPDGWEQKLLSFEPNHFFGELSIMEKRNHEAKAKAAQNTELILLSKAGFEELEEKHSDLAIHIIKQIAIVMSKNLRRMNDKFIKALINY